MIHVSTVIVLYETPLSFITVMLTCILNWCYAIFYFTHVLHINTVYLLTMVCCMHECSICSISALFLIFLHSYFGVKILCFWAALSSNVKYWREMLGANVISITNI